MEVTPKSKFQTTLHTYKMVDGANSKEHEPNHLTYIYIHHDGWKKHKRASSIPTLHTYIYIQLLR